MRMFSLVTSKLDFLLPSSLLFVCWRSASVFFNLAVGSNQTNGTTKNGERKRDREMFIFAFGRLFRSDYGLRMNISLFWPTSLTSFVFVCVFVFFAFATAIRRAVNAKNACAIEWNPPEIMNLHTAKWDDDGCVRAFAREFFQLKLSNRHWHQDKTHFHIFFCRKKCLFYCCYCVLLLLPHSFVPIHKSVSVSFPLPFSGRLWFIARKWIHIKMLLKNLLCCKLISFMSFYMSLVARPDRMNGACMFTSALFFFSVVRPFWPRLSLVGCVLSLGRVYHAICVICCGI